MTDEASTTETGTRNAALADLADLAVHLTRRLEARTFDDPRIVPLSPLESLVLRHVDRHPGISPSQLATDLALRSSNASAVLRSIESKGLLRRSPDPQDARQVHVHPTAAADAGITRVRAEWAHRLSALAREESTEDLATAVRVLSAAVDALDA